MYSSKLLLSAVLAFLSTASLTHAAVVYGVNNLPRPFDAPDELVRFDSSNPSNYTVVGSLGIPLVSMGGLDFDESGNLWAFAALDKYTSGAVSALYRININTGQATQIGPERLIYVQDIAWNPVTKKMYGINSRQQRNTFLYEINLDTGLPTLVGQFTGLPTSQQVQGFAIDAQGNFYIQEFISNSIYKAGPDLAASALYQLTQDNAFSQGMTIDWSGDGTGYHAAVGRGEFPNYFATFNTFATDGSGYTIGPDFGPNEMIGDYGYPPVEFGDIAILPTFAGSNAAIPEPTAVTLLTIPALAMISRRKRR